MQRIAHFHFEHDVDFLSDTTHVCGRRPNCRYIKPGDYLALYRERPSSEQWREEVLLTLDVRYCMKRSIGKEQVVAAGISPRFYDHIGTLGLSTHAYNALVKSGIDTIGELTVCTEAGLLKNVRSFGKHALQNVIDALEKEDLWLASPGNDPIIPPLWQDHGGVLYPVGIELPLAPEPEYANSRETLAAELIALADKLLAVASDLLKVTDDPD